MDPRQAHLDAIQVADDRIGTLQQTLSALIQQSKEAEAALLNATGGTRCPVDAGREAYEMVAQLEDQATELLNRTALAMGQLITYRNGV